MTSTGEHRDVRTWRYDCLGYLKEAVGGGFRYHYEHRPDGKLLCKEVSGHAVLRYTYHPDGNVKTMTDGSGRVLFYGYDHGGRLISVADEAGGDRRLLPYPWREGKGDTTSERGEDGL